MEKKYIVTLTAEERAELAEMIAAGKGAARKLAHARVLLKADATEGGPAWGDAAIADAVEVARTTVERVRRRFVEEGFEAALVHKKPCRPSVPRKIDGRAEAHLVSLACSAAPEGRKEWTMQLLADRMVELGFFESLSDETVRKTLKKTTSSRGSSSTGACRPSGTPSSSATWRTCWRCTPGRRTPNGRRCASTRPASS